MMGVGNIGIVEWKTMSRRPFGPIRVIRTPKTTFTVRLCIYTTNGMVKLLEWIHDIGWKPVLSQQPEKHFKSY